MGLRDLRKNAEITQAEMAKNLGITQGSVSMWETGKSNPRMSDLPKIAAALNVPVEQVLECFTAEYKKIE